MRIIPSDLWVEFPGWIVGLTGKIIAGKVIMEHEDHYWIRQSHGRYYTVSKKYCVPF